MVKLVGAVRNFWEKIKHIQINVEDGTKLVRVILWRKEKECRHNVRCTNVTVLAIFV
jgi:hypothetical protein